MRNSVVIMFMLLLIGIFSFPVIRNIGDSQKEEYMQIEDLSVNAASVESALISTEYNSNSIFPEQDDRKRAIKTFLKNVGKNKGWEGIFEAEAYLRTPVIVLADWDGFYLHYVKDNKEETSSLNTWTATYESGNDAGFIVRYFLDDRIVVMSRKAYEDDDIKKVNFSDIHNKNMKNERYLRYEGTYEEVAKAIIADKDKYFFGAILPGIAFLQDTEAFETEKTRVISESIEEKVNFLINDNTEYNIKGIEYTVNIPKADAYDRKHLRYPFIAAWIQGDQEKTLEGLNNSWAWAASEFEPLELYEIKKEGDKLIYHKKGCNRMEENPTIYRLTMKEAAANGAVPCECVYQ